MNATLSKPRWPGGPKICPLANLPAFTTSDALRSFLKNNGPSCKVVLEWECTGCGHWHAETSAPDPAGASSGNGRSGKGDHGFSLAEMLALGVPEKQASDIHESRVKKEAAEAAARAQKL